MMLENHVVSKQHGWIGEVMTREKNIDDKQRGK